MLKVLTGYIKIVIVIGLLLASYFLVFKILKIDSDITYAFDLSTKEKNAAQYLTQLDAFDRYTLILSLKDSSQLPQAKILAGNLHDSLIANGNDTLYEYVNHQVDEGKFKKVL